MKYMLIIISLTFIFSCKNEGKDVNADFQKKIDSLTTELNKSKTKLSEMEKSESKSKTKYQNEDFDTFFYNFMIDSTFQKSRIQFPLEYHTTDIEIMKDTVINIQKKDWKYNPFYIRTASERTQIYDNFGLEFQPTNERLLYWYGIEAGGDSKYYFKAIERKWYLIKKWDSGI